MASPSITIWGARTTRSDILEMACAELGLEYTFVELDWAAKAHKAPEFLAINPFGQVPAFKDGDLLLTESGACVTYLADKYASKSATLGTPTPESRAVLARWVAFSNSTLCTDLAAKNTRSLDVMEAMLADGREYLTGDYTLADACIAIYLGWMRYFVKCDPGFTLERWPLVKAYKTLVLARPAAKVVDMAWIEDESQWLL